MDGNALAVALALLQTPSLRTALRAQPLPAGIDQLIVLAAGTATALAAAAARTGVAPARVLEAARFYVREILLFPEADAYRVLGVSASASDAQIKLHYRHLQHWLHPDRCGEDWESVFATRINRAWNALRTPSRRAAYDAQATPHAAPRQRVLVNDWRPTAATATGNWRGRWLLGAAVACCLWLAWLVLRQFNAPAPEWRASPQPSPVQQGLAVENMRPLTPAAPETVIEPGRTPGTGAKNAHVMLMSVRPMNRVPTDPAVDQGGGGDPSAETRAVLAVLDASNAACDYGSQAGCDHVPGRLPPHDVPGQALAAAKSSTPPPGPPATADVSPGKSNAPPSVPPASRLSADQLQLVQHRGRDLTRYLASPVDRAPPIWRSAATQDAAASLRGQLLEAGRTVRFGRPDWRIADDRASMTALVHHNEPSEPALALRAEFSWRDGMWLVDRVETERLR